MRVGSAVKSVLLSWDFILAFAITLAFGLAFPDGVSYEIAKETFAVSVSVLSIVFSVFFAALAVLITAGDNEFVRFLEQDGSYRQIVWTFKFTLLILFVALLASIFLFVTVLPCVVQQVPGLYPKYVLIMFVFLGVYALLAAANSSLDAIKYAEFRVRFLEITRQDNDLCSRQ